MLTFSSSDKALLGKICDIVCSFRAPEPYKGTGIMLEGAFIRRKAGKAKTGGA